MDLCRGDRGRNRSATFSRAFALATLVLLWPAIANAQNADGTPPAAGAERSVLLNIPPQPLDTALTSFADQAGLKLLFASQDVGGLRTAGLSGRFTPAEALSWLLSGTGLTYRFADANTASVVKAAPGSVGGAIQLSPIQVEGQETQETPYGPDQGYVAHRSTTGSKTDTPIVETPQSISVVTRQQMEDQDPQRVSQALRYTAGVLPESLGNMTKLESTNIFSRGFPLDEYQDGLKLLGGSWGVAEIEPYNLERIEVLRGPASVLYGQADPAGIVNLVSKRPSAQPFHEVELQGGSFDQIGGAFDFTGPIDKDGKFLYRLTGLGRTADTQVDFTKDQRLTISPALTWQPNEDTSLTFLMNYQYDPGGGFYNWLPAAGTVLHNPNGGISTSFNPGEPDFDEYRRDQYSIGYLFEHRFNDVWSVRQNFRYNHVDTTYDALLAFGLEPDQRTLDRYTWRDKEDIDAFTVDNQVQAKFSTGPLKHTFLLGLDYQRRDYNQKLGYDFATTPSIDVFDPNYHIDIDTPDWASDVDQTTNQIGVYAQDQMRLDHWAFLLGGRNDWADNSYKDHLSDDHGSQSDRKFTWRAGLVYLFDNGLAPYASYSTSFNPQIGTDASGQAFKPTTANQYEIGLKYQPPNFDGFITGSLFQLTEQNVLTVDPNNPGFSVQTGEIRSRGAEVEAHVNITPNWSVVGAYAFLDNDITKANDGTEGNTPAQFPRHMASLWSDYTFDTGALNGLTLGGGVRYVGSSFGDNENSFKVPSYTLFDASLQYDLGALGTSLDGWKLGVNATNLLDRKYVASCNGDSFCAYGLRRTVLARLSFQW
jgi:iron complex outermembrane receptor protein